MVSSHPSALFQRIILPIHFFLPLFFPPIPFPPPAPSIHHPPPNLVAPITCVRLPHLPVPLSSFCHSSPCHFVSSLTYQPPSHPHTTVHWHCFPLSLGPDTGTQPETSTSSFSLNRCCLIHTVLPAFCFCSCLYSLSCLSLPYTCFLLCAQFVRGNRMFSLSSPIPVTR